MTLTGALVEFIGRTVEIFFENSFLQGILTGTSDAFITIDGAGSAYTPAGTINVAVGNVEYIRVLAV